MGDNNKNDDNKRLLDVSSESEPTILNKRNRWRILSNDNVWPLGLVPGSFTQSSLLLK
jgi:hypothetical protein